MHCISHKAYYVNFSKIINIFQIVFTTFHVVINIKKGKSNDIFYIIVIIHSLKIGLNYDRSYSRKTSNFGRCGKI